MKEPDVPVTAAIRALRTAGAAFQPRLYRYVDHGGTRHAAESLQVPEHEVIKTLVMELQPTEGRKTACLILMHGDREVSTKQLARLLEVKTVSPASEAGVEKYTGYVPGGVSPFGTRQRLPVYAEATILELGRLFINGGKRGLLVELTPADLAKAISVTPVQVGIVPSET